MLSRPAPCRPTPGNLRRILFAGLSLATAALGDPVAPTSAAPSASSAADNGTMVQLSPFVVSTTGDTGYVTNDSQSGTRTNEKLTNLPLSVMVIDQQVLTDIAAANWTQAASYYNDANWDQLPDNRHIDYRGFDTIGETMNFHPTSLFYIDDIAIDRVEVITGPNSLLYGASDPGGLQNFITKRPTYDSVFGDASEEFGSYGYERYTAEANAGNAKVAVLSAFADNQNQSWQDYVDSYTRYSYNTIAFHPTPKTNVWLIYEWDHRSKNPGSTGLIDDSVTKLPIYIYGGWTSRDAAMSYDAGPAQVYQGTESDYTATIEQVLTGNWDLELSFHHETGNVLTFNNSGIGTATFDPVRQLYYETVQPLSRNEHDMSEDGRIFTSYKLDLGWTTQTILLGATRIESYEHVFTTRFVTTANLTKADKYSLYILPGDPASNYALPAGGEMDWNNTSGDIDISQFSNSEFVALSGSYWKDRLHTLVGLRLDELLTYSLAPTISSTSPPVLSFGGNQIANLPTQVDPNFGAVYALTSWLSAYGNYSHSIQNSDQYQVDINGNPLPPTKGYGSEEGFKGTLFQSRYVFQLDYFDTHETDIAQAIPNADLPTALQGETIDSSGENAISDGVEFSITANPTPNWTLLANASYNTAHVSADPVTPADIGQSLEGDYKHAINYLTRYQFSSGWTKGLFVGLGFNYRKTPVYDYNGPNGSPRYLPMSDERLYNLFLGYEHRFTKKIDWSLQLNINNLLNREWIYVDTSGDALLENRLQSFVTNTFRF